MRSLAEIDARMTALAGGSATPADAEDMLRLGEEVLEHWVIARGKQPTDDKREGFRLLALHRQGAKGDPSFNACRETCREIVYHYNLLTMQSELAETTNRLEMMKMISSHLYLFVSGKMQVAALGEFCCSAKPIRTSTDFDSGTTKEA